MYKRKIKNMVSILFLFFFLFLLFFFFVGKPKDKGKVIWGVNFSAKHAQNMGLDWKKNYLALLQDLGVKYLKVSAHWDSLEPERGKFSFSDLDWQVEKAKEYGAKIILVIGMKTARWPECHIPSWAKNYSKRKQQEEILKMLKEVVLRYKNSPAIEYWQVENEPLFPFGHCPWADRKFLAREVKLVKSLDKRKVIISDSGEDSLWFQAGRLGDIVGVTMYRKVWFSLPFLKSKKLGFYLSYPLPPVFYARKAFLVKKLFEKQVFCVELQAEPWGQVLLYDLPLSEQMKTMNLAQFRKNIRFARKTGLKRFYLWGGEWWYWMKVKKNKPAIWNEAKKLFQ